ncbi:MAG: hypothetical protein NOF05_07440 [Candidatus Accumulibacter phosphatis]|nr:MULTISPECIES: hypothetical protein [Candidatus Accumulibacter]MBL8400880.1 hypothetical protein [Accumulibacter sp.]MBN8516339.1 hypothetical protein [Accumulibacter sp.]MBO3711996.1 hypothetical protein [Accumulibacter sp.]MCC2867128.1 hypothetical protein [Candidatus Accumulibacter phosphatis]MCQ1548643.1 hypothetical protein [Candidatus Accumulibacter phosphatis]
MPGVKRGKPEGNADTGGTSMRQYGPSAEQHLEMADALPGNHGPGGLMMAVNVSRAEARELQRYRHFYLSIRIFWRS